MPRRTYQETQELVGAAKQNYIDGAYSEAVLRATLKSLGLPQDEVEWEINKACQEWARLAINRASRKSLNEETRLQASIGWLRNYLKK